MSSQRLTFLYPIFYRSVQQPKTLSRPSSKPPRAHSARSTTSFSTSCRRREAAPQRYGTAQEPQPHLGGGQPVISSEFTPSKPEDAVKAKGSPTKTPPSNEKPAEAPKVSRDEALDASEATPATPIPDAPNVAQAKPLETVLTMPSPSEEEAKKHPHFTAPPYVHHFDTWSLVKDLEKSGFEVNQAITIMKAVRGILTDNMQLAREGLVSKGDVENETYLFRAACSELRTEIANSRHTETEKMQTARNHLQHEVDILNQRMTQESLTLKNDLKGMFDDRKMAVRTEQRNMETKIQELNYKITVALNSDARSEVEGLRWVLTRRAAIAVGISAVLILGTLRYSSYMTKLQETERKRLKNARLEDFAESGGAAASSSNGNGAGDGGSPMAMVRGEDAVGDDLLISEGGVQLG